MLTQARSAWIPVLVFVLWFQTSSTQCNTNPFLIVLPSNPGSRYIRQCDSEQDLCEKGAVLNELGQNGMCQWDHYGQTRIRVSSGVGFAIRAAWSPLLRKAQAVVRPGQLTTRGGDQRVRTKIACHRLPQLKMASHWFPQLRGRDQTIAVGMHSMTEDGQGEVVPTIDEGEDPGKSRREGREENASGSTARGGAQEQVRGGADASRGSGKEGVLWAETA
eukprot:134294-Rhodomonas_salina.1